MSQFTNIIASFRASFPTGDIKHYLSILDYIFNPNGTSTYLNERMFVFCMSVASGIFMWSM